MQSTEFPRTMPEMAVNPTSETTPLYSVIIPTCHRNDLLAKCLSCLAPGNQICAYPCGDTAVVNSEIASDEWPITYEVIVSDDGEASTSQDMIKKLFPWVRWHQGPKMGPAANRNSGASQAKGEWLVFTDDDCLPQPGWLQAFHVFRENYRVLEGRTIADRLRKRQDETSPVNETGGFLWSCNFAILKDLFDQLEGFDENFPFAASEDVDLRERIILKNIRFPFVNDALVVHPLVRLRGIGHELKRLSSDLYLHNKLSHLRPESYFWYYIFRGFRSMMKSTLPGLITFKGQGFLNALMIDVLYLFLAFRSIFKTPHFPAVDGQKYR